MNGIVKSKIYRFQRNRKIIIFTFIILPLLLSFIPFLNNNGISNSSSKDIRIPIPENYSSNKTSSTDSVSLLLHQAYRNETITAFNEVHNSFSVPAPLDPQFNTSYIKIDINDTKANNYSLIIEDDSPDSSQNLDKVNVAVVSFTVPQSCYLYNVSFDLDLVGSGTGQVSVYLINSSWDNVNGRSKPGVSGSDALNNQLGLISSITADGWYTLTGLNEYLNISETENNTWFLVLKDEMPSFVETDCFRVSDGSSGDNNDEAEVYQWNNLNSQWDYYTYDLDSKVGLGISQGNVKPSTINMCINSTPITDGALTGEGSWTSLQEYSGSNGKITFNFSSDWYSYSFNMILTQVNYTKSDIVPTTTFSVTSNQDTFWNSSAVINLFVSTLDNNTINYTVPISWNNISMVNGSTTIAHSLYTSTDYKTVTIYGANATNGNWSLLAQTNNYITDITTAINNIPTTTAWANQTLEINATFLHPITGNVNLSIYSPAAINDELNYTEQLNIGVPSTSITFTDWIIPSTVQDYGEFRIQVSWSNATEAGLLEQHILIAAPTEINITPASGYEVQNTDPKFNLTLNYFDKFKNVNITGATIGHNATGSWESEVQNNADQTYNVTIDPSTYSLGKYYIEIMINKTNHQNYTILFELNIVNSTQIWQMFEKSNLQVTRGDNATFYLNYNQTNFPDNYIQGATITAVNLNSSLIWSWKDLSEGNYSIDISTLSADAGVYLCRFNISKLMYQTQVFEFNITVLKDSSEIILINKTNVVARNSGLNVTIYALLNDTYNSVNITGATNSFILYNGSNPSQEWNVGNWNYYVWEVGNGQYGFNISLNSLDSGNYSVIIHSSFTPNYNESSLLVDFYLRGNLTQIKIDDIDNGAGIPLVNESGVYKIYQHSTKIGLQFNIFDLEMSNTLITSDMGTFNYWAYFNNSELLPVSFSFDKNINKNTGYLSLNPDLAIGNYTLELVVGMNNYENASFTFNISIIAELPVHIEIVKVPQSIVQGTTATIIVKAYYLNGSEIPLQNAELVLSTNISKISIISAVTNSSGYATFELVVPVGDYVGIQINVSYNGIAYGINSGNYIANIKLLPPAGMDPRILYAILFIIGTTLIVSGVYKGVIVPKKRRRKELLFNTASAFDDAVNLQHILVIYKNTGTCIYFKSFGLEEIDPDLITGFLSALQSFTQESMGTDGISEMDLRGKHLIVSDGEFVRVALVIGKPASKNLRTNLSRFVMLFEGQYHDALDGWRGQLNVFKSAGKLVDEVLNTSIILPHKITSDLKVLKSVGSGLERVLLKTARELTGERDFFFIAQLISLVEEKMKKKPPEILLALDKLLKTKVFVPIDISELEKQVVSPQEQNLIIQRVNALEDIPQDQKEILIQDLINMSPAEREATLTSLQQGVQIQSKV
ncbi:MAG: hypothetical protein ACTSXF_03875, partial [Promethearchaeota archaeon]